MDAIAVLKDLAQRPLEAARRLADGLTPEQLNAHPGSQDNSIAWLLWHTGREIDAQTAQLSGREQAWTADGYADRFSLPLDPADHGYGHTAEQARSVEVDDAGLLLDYLEAAVAAETAYLDTLSAEDLDEVIDSSFDPPVTRGARLVSLSEDALQHVGQAAYAQGVLGA